MLLEDHLTLRSISLKASEEFSDAKKGLGFIFFKEGHGEYVSKAGNHKIGPGSVLVLSEACSGKLHASDKGELVFKRFCLDVEHLFPLFGCNEISSLQNVVASLTTAKIQVANSPLARESHTLLETVPTTPNLAHRGHLLKIAALLLSPEFENAQTQRGAFAGSEERMIDLFERLSASELLNLSVGELAKKFNCSRRHLTRLFQKHFGLSVATLKMEMRLLNAVSLLRNPQAKVINVAEQCGFNHLGLFNTCFKRRFGTSPGQWRKINLNTEKASTTKVESKQICPLHTNGLCAWNGHAKILGRL